MTSLRDPFEVIHKKEVETKKGTVILDYIQWVQAADRLDEVHPDGWSFEVVQFGADFVHGRLRIGERVFENIGYAENAEKEWKKEVLKDAVSDAFKRCAAMAGAGRYLYERDVPTTSARPSSSRPAAHSPAPPTPARQVGPLQPAAAGAPGEPPLFDDLEEDFETAKAVARGEVKPPENRPLDIRDGYYGPGCPVHKDRDGNPRPWHATYNKCTAKDPEGKNGYCEWRPSKRWTAEHEVSAV